MEILLLYRQLEAQLRQCGLPKDKRHLQGYVKAVAAILQLASVCLSHWLPDISHRDCKARAHMERFSYLVHNEHTTTNTSPRTRHCRALLSTISGASPPI